MIVLKSKTFSVGARCGVWCKMRYYSSLSRNSNVTSDCPSHGNLFCAVLNGTLNSSRLDNFARSFSKYMRPYICPHWTMAMISPNSRGSGERPSGQTALLYGSTRPHLQVLNSYLSSQAKDVSNINHNLTDDANPRDHTRIDMFNSSDADFSVEKSKEKIKYLHFHSSCSLETVEEVTSSFQVVSDFISIEEEEILMKEVEPHFKRLQYEFDHWDDAIHGFREIERGRWGKSASPIISRMKKYAFPEEQDLIAQVHILDLAKTGVIKPHVDSVRFCGNIISGVCLLSDAVMRLVHVNNKDQVIDVMLPRRALYIMRDGSRYNYTHEILEENKSFFGSIAVLRDRRVSVICRNNPKEGNK
ncbi:uncharacterized protein LOC135214864 [Macrobrachium nipponense]|uniref:uncharacterized protein LOC135214864 n=1 Tax=Macrobrachium nipponense TaxID=159736 RepID=UPI0030C80FF6